MMRKWIFSLLLAPLLVFGQSYYMDCANDYNEIVSYANIENVFAAGGTIGGWFYVDATSDDGDRLWNKTEIQLRITGMDGSNYDLFFFQDFTVGSDLIMQTSGTVFAVDTWYHFAVSYDNNPYTNRPTLYGNGVSQSWAETSTPSSQNPDTDAGDLLTVGARNTGANQLTGRFGPFTVISQELSTAEGLEFYQESKDHTGWSFTANVVGQWEMNEGSGQSIANEVTGNTMTLGATPGSADGSDPTWTAVSTNDPPYYEDIPVATPTGDSDFKKYGTYSRGWKRY